MSYPQRLSTALKNLWTTRQNHAQVIHILASNLTRLVASTLASEPLERIARRRCLVLVAALCILQTPLAKGDNNNGAIEAYKIYAHIKVGNDKQYRCLVSLWTLESHWNSKAKNKRSSAYGIPQLLKMKETNPYKQIDLGLKYIYHHRLYKGDICKALAIHKRVGYY